MVGVLLKESGVNQFPLLVDYGQRARFREWQTCQLVHKKYSLPEPTRMDVSGFGAVIASGLTRESLDIKHDAFTPGRNLLFLLLGASYAFQVGAEAISIGLLTEELSLFPDQRAHFLEKAEDAIGVALGKTIRIVAPLFAFRKAEVVGLASEKGITETYSCHTGNEEPCGKCISCLEYVDGEDK
jgi:7-cyano-7-deazaguanine synthase